MRALTIIILEFNFKSLLAQCYCFENFVPNVEILDDLYGTGQNVRFGVIVLEHFPGDPHQINVLQIVNILEDTIPVLHVPKNIRLEGVVRRVGFELGQILIGRPSYIAEVFVAQYKLFQIVLGFGHIKRVEDSVNHLDAHNRIIPCLQRKH